MLLQLRQICKNLHLLLYVMLVPRNTFDTGTDNLGLHLLDLDLELGHNNTCMHDMSQLWLHLVSVSAD